MFRSISILIIVASLSGSWLGAGEWGGFHDFTAKNGNTVRAKLLDVSEDLRTMKIEREDGLEFESEIVTVSLDDQQFVKDWMANRPAEPEVPSISADDFRLELTLSKKSLDTERPRSSSQRALEQGRHVFEIGVRNMSRETLEGAQYEYVIVIKDILDLVQEFGFWDSRFNRSRTGAPKWSHSKGSGDLDSLAFNRETLLTTEPYVLDRVMFDREVVAEDELIGIIVRVLTPEGEVIAEERLGGPEIDDLTWENATGEDSGSPTEDPFPRRREDD